jgi:restriction system protein
MARKRSRHNSDSSVLAIALNSHWGVSAAFSALVFGFAYVIAPAYAKSNVILTSVLSGLKPVILLVGGTFALIAIVNFFRQRTTSEITSTAPAHFPRKQTGFISAGAGQGVTQITPKIGTQRGNSATQTLPTPVVEPALVNSQPDKPAFWNLELLQKIEWKLFEDLSAAYYKEMGIRAELTKLGADGGIDIKLFQDDSGAPTAIVQCKAWNSKLVGVKPIREFLGVMSHEKISKGFFMASGAYSDDAKGIAKANGITLINGVMFLSMLKRLSEEAQLRLLNLVTAGDFTTPSCPSCGIKMVRRTGKRGDFWGCQNYPKCRQMLNMKNGV